MPILKDALKKGTANGDLVKLLKQKLNSSSIKSTLDVNNPSFGDSTEAVVKQFQALVGIAQTGIVDEVTWGKLFNVTTTAQVILITPDQLRKICRTISEARSVVMARHLNTICPKYGIDTIDEFEEFISQIAHESSEFTIKTEKMNYSARRMAEIWPYRFAIDPRAKPPIPNQLAMQLANNPEALANNVYANRMGNGASSSGDGYRNRGGGFCQITGYESFKKYADYIGKSVDDTAILVRTTDEYALDSACWLFAIEKKLLDDAERDDYITITKRINGGLIGLADRQKYYERAKQVLRA